VDLVSLGEQEFGEVGAVLSGDSCDECFLQTAVSLGVSTMLLDRGGLGGPQ